jgi:hypothetical protein
MTRRERLERKLERRQQWAESREAKASAVLDHRPAYASDWAFITQPGHIPARAKLIAAEDRAFENLKVAEHHQSKAAGLAQQLDKAIFSDDSDAVEAIEERIRDNEAKRERMRKVNAMYRKGDAAGLAALGLSLDNLRAEVARLESWQDQQPYAKYQLSNLGGRISSDKKRLEHVKAQQARAAEAQAAPNGVTIKSTQCGSSSYTTVTFAEKPGYSIIRALKDAGYRWGAGNWFGQTEKLPTCVAEMAGAQ